MSYVFRYVAYPRRGFRQNSLISLLVLLSLLGYLYYTASVRLKEIERQQRIMAMGATDDDEYDHESGRIVEWKAKYDRDEYVYQKFNRSCYMPNMPPYLLKTPVKESVLKQRGCERRLPSAIIAGVRKCGTTPLMNFLLLHPSIVGPGPEPHYFDAQYDKGIDWYRNQMPYSAPHQITIEKTPTYFIHPHDVPPKIRMDVSLNTKIILILCDPVHRLVSDYLEWTMKQPKFSLGMRHKFIAETFEKSVIEGDRFGTVNMFNEIVDLGVYVKHMIRWFEYFPPGQIMIIDGETFKLNPVQELQRLEDFLGIRPFFQTEHFYYDSTKNFFCMAFPEKRCLGSSKGRTHPDISERILKTLCEYYRPYDITLSKMTDMTFSWLGKC
ncbi:heparan sulfate glucosamine 3-O-sulfotransferase 1-like [Saccoglossus kowalevskii]|uniref:Heparan sulfate glucosamine 3-O-sulfotransferase 3A1-like n=1 Tax=Saccoglossus kowalevskii TaxID=10224 RepID=A0ABM0GW71_SACKO|nr:PREDICTED: heparan sulfate glucosamine 3-O-sulfotransferase 3A1-like [Saccoglossus kowalevskii]